ncbi:sensor histidine kinase [Kitasatospora nipponensis]|uniref:histidine kinase n=1 Tax=Kitasatospora nipponensis TaxID=258049 RepID=A0ABP4DUB1_9ACTN
MQRNAVGGRSGGEEGAGVVAAGPGAGLGAGCGARWVVWRPWVTDVGIAVALTVVSVLLGHERPPHGWRPLNTEGYLLTCAVNLVLVGRRRFPMTVLMVAGAFWILYIADGFWPVVDNSGPFVAFYTVSVRRGATATAVGGAVIAAIWIGAGLDNAQSDMGSVIAQALVIPAILTRFGRHERELGIRNRQLGDLAQQLAEQQEARAEHAVTQERLRIARELHDVVAHHLSVISVQAGLADYVFSSDPPTARTALRTIAETSRETLEEMRSLLQVLRLPPGDGLDPPGDSLRPTPGLARLGDLVERVEAAGVRTEVRLSGVRRALPSGVDLCAYRIVQEALTNVLKHAGPTEVVLAVHYGRDRLTGRITDSGGGVPLPVSAPNLPGGGHGLIGMRERVRLYGGELRAAPLTGGRGFEVHFTIPIGPPLPAPPPPPAPVPAAAPTPAPAEADAPAPATPDPAEPPIAAGRPAG